MENMINVGVAKETVQEAASGILAIIESNNSEGVKIAALQTLATICKVENTTIESCHFENHQPSTTIERQQE